MKDVFASTGITVKVAVRNTFHIYTDIFRIVYTIYTSRALDLLYVQYKLHKFLHAIHDMCYMRDIYYMTYMYYLYIHIYIYPNSNSCVY